MQAIDETVFQNLSLVKRLADGGFLESFLKLYGSEDVGGQDSYGLTWDAIACVFPGVTGYFNQEIEVDTIVIFDPLVDELCRLLTRYEMSCGVTPGESGLRHEVTQDICQAFELDEYTDGYYVYDYDFRIYDTGHGRKRLVLLMGTEFCGFRNVPSALVDVRCALENQIRRLRKELGVEPIDEHTMTEKEAA